MHNYRVYSGPNFTGVIWSLPNDNPPQIVWHKGNGYLLTNSPHYGWCYLQQKSLEIP